MKGEAGFTGTETEHDLPIVRWKSCSDCSGAGDSGGEVCAACDGIGFIPKTSTLVDKMVRKASLASKNKKTKKYIISSGGNDALLQFGRHTGQCVSGVAHDDPSYLVWMLTQSFPNDLVDILLLQLDDKLGSLSRKDLESMFVSLGIRFKPNVSASLSIMRSYIARRLSLRK